MPLVFSSDKLVGGFILSAILIISGLIILFFEWNIGGFIFFGIFAGLSIMICIISTSAARIKNYSPTSRTPDKDNVRIEVPAEPIINTVCTTVQPGQMIDNSCQICINNAWQITLRCGHLICKECLDGLPLDNGVQTCPFCRAPINHHEATPIFIV